jgi:hypothetical protein
VGPAGGAAERQAEQQAARVMAGTPSTPAQPAAPATLDGVSLPAPLRGFYEPRFGQSLGHIRLHTGAAAQREAHALQAHAFTHDHHVWLGRGRDAAPSMTLAHELVHALQHDRTTIWREPYETRVTELSREQNQALASRSYWEGRVMQRYDLTLDSHLRANPEERDAALAMLWTLGPTAPVGARSVTVVPIAARSVPAAAVTGSSPAPAPTLTPELMVRFVFDRPASRGALSQVSVEFVGAGSALNPILLPEAPAGFTPAAVIGGWSQAGFPAPAEGGIQPDDYWSRHPAEHAALFRWIQGSAPAQFSQAVTTETRRGGRVTHRSTFIVSGRHAGNDIHSVRFVLAGEVAAEPPQTAPADYRGHGDALDAEFDRLRARSTDRLGSVTLPAGLPADEVVPVKEAVRRYFETGGARNTEVDVIVPVGPDARSVLVTLIFGTGNDVAVTRIGEAGSGQVQLDRLDVRRVRGFPASGNAAALRSWWTARYPGAGALAAPATAAPAALVSEMNTLLDSGVAAAGWFNTVYGIEAMTGAATTARLRTAHGMSEAMAADAEDLTATDLRMLELSLQTLSDSERTRLRGLKIGRKAGSFRQGARGALVAGSAQDFGYTLQSATGELTTVFFQPLHAANAALFRGGSAASALPEVTMRMLHELGHATGYTAGIETAFRAWLALHPQAAPTRYAASAGGAEMFPEVWALHHTDPHFLCASAPELYAWLEALASTGSAPAADSTLVGPTSCPP